MSTVDNKESEEKELQKQENNMAPNNEPTSAAAAPTETAVENENAKLNNATEDEEKVKFTNNDETKVVIQDPAASPTKKANLYPALTKAELMHYATDPFWVKLRWALFILFWVAWVAMLATAIVIIVLAPKCPRPAEKEWWQKGPVYQVYPKSFKDSDGNGVGDLKGVTSKIDYLANLGVGAVWMSPICKSPDVDNGYDVQDYRAIDPKFGSIEDFKGMLAGLHDYGIQLIMDLVPNHSSDQHEWFQKSVKREEPYTDYYIWQAGSPSSPPNNWKSVFGGPAWTYNSVRGEWYLHQFYSAQPDLNLRNEKVKQEIKDIMKYWLDMGVDGFRIDAVAHFFEDESYPDEVVLKPGGDSYDSVEHKYSFNLPEVLTFLHELRQVLDAKTEEDTSQPRIMMTEAYLPAEELVKYYGYNTMTPNKTDISQMPLNFAFIEQFKSASDLNAANVHSVIKNYMDALPNPTDTWPNFNMGNHDNSRTGSRFGSELVDAMNMIMMMLPGTPITYYGEELGMADTALTNPDDERDPERTPMPWDSTATTAGFTSGTPWLAVGDLSVNVADQEAATNSHLKIYRELAGLREEQSVLYGSINMEVSNGGDVFSMSRVRKGNPGYLIAVNFGDTETNLVLNGTSTTHEFLADRGTVHLRSVINGEAPADDPLAVGKTVTFDSIPLKAKEAVMFSYVPQLKK